MSYRALSNSALLASVLAIALSTRAQAQQHEKPAPMTQESNIAQVVFISVDSANADARREDIEAGRVGGVLLQWGDYSLGQTKALVDKLQSWAAKSPSATPLLIAADYEGGTVFTPATLGLPNLPSNMMMGAAADEKDCAMLFYLAGLELRKTGIHISFAPVLDVNTNPRNPVIGVRSFGADPELTGRMGVAVISGLKAAGIVAVPKHFPGHGDAHTDSHLELPVISLDKTELREKHVKPFADAISAGAEAVLTAHVLYRQMDKDNPATFSKIIIKDLLRGELGFKGLVFTDSLDMKGASAKTSTEQAALRALQAGADVLLIGGGDPKKTLELLSREHASVEGKKRLDAASEAVLELKKKLGLFAREPKPELKVDMAYESTARSIAEKSVTVAWDRAGAIPLPKPKHGLDKPSLCGIFFSPPRYSYELLEINRPLLESGWLVNHYNAPLSPAAKDLSRARDCAQKADVLLIGTFQWADKPLPAQKKAVGELLKLKKPTVLISMMSPYDILHYKDAPTVLVTYGATKFSMQAAGRILSGELLPAGELPFPLEEPAKAPKTSALAGGGVR